MLCGILMLVWSFEAPYLTAAVAGIHETIDGPASEARA